MFDSFLVGTKFLDVSPICGPIHAGSMVETAGTHSYSTYSSIIAVVLAVEILRVCSVLIRDDTYSSSTDSSDACSSYYIVST